MEELERKLQEKDAALRTVRRERNALLAATRGSLAAADSLQAEGSRLPAASTPQSSGQPHPGSHTAEPTVESHVHGTVTQGVASALPQTKPWVAPATGQGGTLSSSAVPAAANLPVFGEESALHVFPRAEETVTPAAGNNGEFMQKLEDLEQLADALLDDL